MAKTYYEKLRDPRWQRKRLEIMERDGFACILCGSTGDTLNVDHAYYAPKTEPWEYPDDSLSTLCESCHACTERYRRELLAELAGMSMHILRSVPALLRFIAKDDSESIGFMMGIDERDDDQRIFGVERTLEEAVEHGLGIIKLLKQSEGRS